MSTAAPPGTASASTRCPVSGTEVWKNRIHSISIVEHIAPAAKMMCLHELNMYNCIKGKSNSRRVSCLCRQRSWRHSRRVRYCRLLCLSCGGCGSKGAIHVQRRGARVGRVGARWRGRRGYHLQRLWRRTRLRPEHKHLDFYWKYG